MGTSVFCIAPSEMIANDIVARLKSAGFANNDISALWPDTSGTRDLALEKKTKSPEGATVGAGAGGVVGGALGLLAGVGMLAIPGLGPFIAAGPIMAALSGAGIGAAVGGLTGSLVGLGIPEFEAKRYEGKIKGGSILISVHAASSERESTARRIFEDARATDITSSSESSTPREDEAPEIHTMPRQVPTNPPKY